MNLDALDGPGGALVLLVLAVGLSGCLTAEEPRPASASEDEAPANLTAGLSQPAFEVSDPEGVWIPASSDDTEMFAKVWRPDVANSSSPGWKAPLILVMTPYQGYDGREDPTDATSRPSSEDYSWLIERFVPRGYAVAFLDVRGTGESGGCLEQTGEKQRQDGYDAVEFFADRDWSSGEVGMYGRSYRAETQLGTAAMAPEHLSTIVPVASVSGQYEWNYYDGVPFTLHTLVGNAAYFASEGAQPSTEPNGLAQYPSKLTCQPEILTQDLEHSGDWNDYWQERELRDYVHRMNDTSVLYVHGLQDWNVRQVAIRDMWDRIPTDKRAVFGQWSHAFPDNGYGDEPVREDWRAIVHAWYDHELLDRDNGVVDLLPPVQVQDSTGDWRAEDTWPPKRAEPRTLHLSSEGQLARGEASTLDPPLVFRENTEAFARNATGAPTPTVEMEDYPDRLVFESAPLEEEVHVAGWPTLNLSIALTDELAPDPDEQIDAHLAANLRLVGPDGDREWINSGYTSARHLDGLDRPSPAPEDERLTYAIDFHPQDTVLPEGTQVELVLSGSDRWTEAQGSLFVAELHEGSLTLPTVDVPGSAGLQPPLLDPSSS